MKNKKNGSALLTVVCLCAFLSVLTISIMAMTTGGYSLRKGHNKRVENFYSADSGIEIAESEIVKVINEGIEKANEYIEDIKKDPTGHPGIPTHEVGWEQKPFKQKFEEYIGGNLENRIDNVSIAVPSPIYDGFKRDEKTIKVDAIDNGMYQDGNQVVTGSDDYSKDRENKWEIKSNFKDKEEKEREVVVNYNIKTPKYGIQAGEAVENSSIFDYIMAVDGNLNVYNGASFLGLGDMWVGGDNQQGDRSSLDSNYKPGILMKDRDGLKGKMEWNGDIITPKDMMVDNNTLKVENIYSDDLVIKYDKAEWEGTAVSILDVKEDINVYNDLVFDVEVGNLSTKNYYGLNDIDRNINPEEEDLLQDKANWGKSSSIIVSSEKFGENSKINILNDMYVMGTAYLQLDGVDYKTGESIAINKYSEPYTSRTLNGIGEDAYLYKYINPLHVVDKKFTNGEYKNLSITNKVDIVKNALEGKLDENIFKGVEIGNKAYTAGVMYDTGAIAESFGTIEDCPDKKERGHNHTIVECKQKEFVEKAYNMGGELSKAEAETYFDDKTKLTSVEDSFNWKFIRDNLMTDTTIKDKTGDIIFERNESLVYPKVGKEKDVVVFQSTKTVAEMIPDHNIEYFTNKKINIIFNVSRQEDTTDRPKELFFIPGITELQKGIDDEIELPIELINSDTAISVVISDGGINVIQGSSSGPIQVKGVFYSKDNMNLSNASNMNFGNESVPDFTQLNKIFEKLFGGVIDGVVDGGIIDQGNGETVNNASDLLEQEDWNLIK